MSDRFPAKNMVETASAILKCNEVCVTLFSVEDKDSSNSLGTRRTLMVYGLLSAFRNDQPSRPSARVALGKVEVKSYEGEPQINISAAGLAESLYALCCFLIASGVEMHVTKLGENGRFRMERLNIHGPNLLPVFDVEHAFYTMTDTCLIGNQ